MAEKGLDNLFYDTLRDIYYAERHILKTLPKLAAASSSEELQAAFRKHHDETAGQIERLEGVFQTIDRKPVSKRCEAIDGILKEGDGMLADYSGTVALDAGLISSAQAVEHYEITRYGTLRRWAKMLTLTDAVDLLAANLEEEVRTDELLTKLADTQANARAATGNKPAAD
ncbi:MAG: ferritin-like domain-containing protein [Candidatus Nanopelagicales bacterium]